MALVHQIIDFIDDVDRTLFKVAAASAPQELRTAKILSSEDRELLPDENFALVLHTKEAHQLKKFPITDQANTWLSCQYFEKTSEQLPFVAQKVAATNLKRACLVYGLPVSSGIDKLASSEIYGNRYDEMKNMKEDSHHSRTPQFQSLESDGSEHFFALGERYPMPNEDLVKRAASYFKDHYREFADAEDRATYASNVLARADELGVTLEKTAGTLLQTYSSESYGDSVDAQIRMRSDLLSHKPEMSHALAKLAQHRQTTEAPVFAKALYLFDKKAGLTKYYDGYLSDAFKSTFGSFNKTASAGYRWEDEQSGSSIDGELLSQAAEDKYEKIKTYFGSTLADSFKKHAVAIFDSLPLDAKTTIVKIAKGTL